MRIFQIEVEFTETVGFLGDPLPKLRETMIRTYAKWYLDSLFPLCYPLCGHMSIYNSLADTCPHVKRGEIGIEKIYGYSWPEGLPEPPLLHERSERRDASEHRRHILEVAQHLFAEHGVDVVSMHQIARTAGVGQGTLYRRYKNKGELCMALLSERHERFVQDMATLLAEKAASPALERLDGVLTQIITLLEEQSTLLGPAIMPDINGSHCKKAHKSQHFSFQETSWHHWFYSLIVELLTEAVKQEELISLDVPYTTDAILITFHPLFYRFQRLERGFSMERILQGARRIYIEGLKTSSLS